MAGKQQKELRQENDFETQEQETIVSLLYTNELFQHRFGQFFRKHGINQAQYNVLRILKVEGKPIPSREIVKRMIAVVPAITSSINQLEKSGYVTRQRCDEDRRVFFVSLTTLGKKLLKKIAKPCLEMHHSLVGHLTKKQRQQLINLLEIARVEAKK